MLFLLLFAPQLFSLISSAEQCARPAKFDSEVQFLITQGKNAFELVKFGRLIEEDFQIPQLDFPDKSIMRLLDSSHVIVTRKNVSEIAVAVYAIGSNTPEHSYSIPLLVPIENYVVINSSHIVYAQKNSSLNFEFANHTVSFPFRVSRIFYDSLDRLLYVTDSDDNLNCISLQELSQQISASIFRPAVIGKLTHVTDFIANGRLALQVTNNTISLVKLSGGGCQQLPAKSTCIMHIDDAKIPFIIIAKRSEDMLYIVCVFLFVITGMLLMKAPDLLRKICK
jgi:hypothetical protein